MPPELDRVVSLLRENRQFWWDEAKRERARATAAESRVEELEAGIEELLTHGVDDVDARLKYVEVDRASIDTLRALVPDTNKGAEDGA